MGDKAKKGIWVLIVLTLFIAGFLYINSDDMGVQKGALIYVGIILGSIALFWLAREFKIIKKV